MFRFTIRELVLVTVAAAFATGWWIERRAVSREHTMLREKVRFLEAYLSSEPIPECERSIEQFDRAIRDR